MEDLALTSDCLSEGQWRFMTNQQGTSKDIEYPVLLVDPKFGGVSKVFYQYLHETTGNVLKQDAFRGALIVDSKSNLWRVIEVCFDGGRGHFGGYRPFLSRLIHSYCRLEGLGVLSLGEAKDLTAKYVYFKEENAVIGDLVKIGQARTLADLMDCFTS